MNFVLIKIQTWLERLNSEEFITFRPMYYVYLLLSEKDKSFYIGYSSDLKKRIKEHNEGKSIATKHKRPYKLIFYEAFLNRIDAKHREKYLKNGWGLRSIKKLLKRYLGEVA